MRNLFICAKKYFQKNWGLLVILSLATAFFIGVSSYNRFITQTGPVKWLSPDETANYIFAKLYGQTGEMIIYEKYNLAAGDTIHPRSIRSDNGSMKPVSFLGIIFIYGKIIKVSGYGALPYLTPFFASAGIVFFYLLIKKIFGAENALLSSFLLASFPPYIYYSARSMFHNVLFFSLLIAGFYFLVLMCGKRKKKGWLSGDRSKAISANFGAPLGGYFIGLAAITRSSELLWILPILLIAWIFNFRKVGFLKLILFLSGFFLALMPVFYWNQVLFNSPINTGYPELNQSVKNIANAGSDLIKSTLGGELAYHQDLLGVIKGNVFYFGLKVEQSIKMFYYYFVDMFYWLFWPAFIGFILFLERIYRWKRKHFVYIFSLVTLMVILIFYYGSWEFHDNPDPNSHTIGNSYTRYWLPIYAGLMPLASIFLIRLARALYGDKENDNIGRFNIINHPTGYGQAKNFWAKNIAWPRRIFLIQATKIIFLILIFYASIQFVLFGSEEGLIYSAQKQKESYAELNKVLSLTESNSVIITTYHDKLFFPERKVIVGLFNDDNMNSYYSKLAGRLPVYYYNFTLPEKDIEYLNNKFVNLNLSIEKKKTITPDLSLYKLKKVSD